MSERESKLARRLAALAGMPTAPAAAPSHVDCPTWTVVGRNPTGW
jgi:hypothetical protein